MQSPHSGSAADLGFLSVRSNHERRSRPIGGSGSAADLGSLGAKQSRTKRGYEYLPTPAPSSISGFTSLFLVWFIWFRRDSSNQQKLLVRFSRRRSATRKLEVKENGHEHKSGCCQKKKKRSFNNFDCFNYEMHWTTGVIFCAIRG